MAGFFDVYLRTTDADGAREFYEAVLGHERAVIYPLHENAIARGAKPHWLGFVDAAPLGGVDAAADAFVARGAQLLGPKWVNPAGLTAAVLRDPGGAIVAVAERTADATSSGLAIAWHALHTPNEARAIADYGDLFGWSFGASIEVVGVGAYHPLAFSDGDAIVGSVSGIADRPSVHPHWLFHVHVPSLDAALEAVVARGGTHLDVVTLAGGARIAVCDDPQGAAFGLWQSSS